MYYLVILQNPGYDNAAQAVYAYEDFDSALAAFHSELAYRADSRKSTVCVILDSDGFTAKTESWKEPVEIVEQSSQSCEQAEKNISYK